MSAVDEHRTYAPQALSFTVLTCSDSRTLADDTSGDHISAMIEAAGYRVGGREIVRDEIAPIRGSVKAALERPDCDVVVITGGTGFSPRDVTLEAVEPLLERVVSGFGELFRMLSFEQVGAAAMLSRALAGVVGRRAVFILPGSPRAVTLAMEKLVLPEVSHLLGQLRRTP